MELAVVQSALGPPTLTAKSGLRHSAIRSG
jgi:hypothetical protein